MDIWLPVKSYEDNYLISSSGELKCLYKNFFGKLKSQYVNYKGYCYVSLYKNSSRINKRIHRLVAEAFIPNTENKPHVNHINGIKTDNRVENLEWATNIENRKHAVDNGLHKSYGYSSILIIDVDTGKEYKSLSEASDFCGWSRKWLSKMLKGEIKNKTTLKFKQLQHGTKQTTNYPRKGIRNDEYCAH